MDINLDDISVTYDGAAKRIVENNREIYEAYVASAPFEIVGTAFFFLFTMSCALFVVICYKWFKSAMGKDRTDENEAEMFFSGVTTVVFFVTGFILFFVTLVDLYEALFALYHPDVYGYKMLVEQIAKLPS